MTDAPIGVRQSTPVPFVQITYRLLDSPVSSNAKILYVALRRHADSGGLCWPSVATLAKEISSTRPTVRKAMDELVEAGMVRLSARLSEGKTNLYTVLASPDEWGKGVEKSFPGGVEKSFPGGGNDVSRGWKDSFHELDTRTRSIELETTTTTTSSASAEGGGGPAQSQSSGASKNGHEGKNGARDIWGTPGGLVVLWNERAPKHVPRVTTVSTARLKRISHLLRQFPDRAWWERVMAEYKASDFLSGTSKPSEGHENWKPDFDWLLSNGKGGGVENVVKVHDGGYRNAVSRRREYEDAGIGGIDLGR